MYRSNASPGQCKLYGYYVNSDEIWCADPTTEASQAYIQSKTTNPGEQSFYFKNGMGTSVWRVSSPKLLTVNPHQNVEWPHNALVKMTNSYASNLNFSNCWVCTRLPKHPSVGIPLIGLGLGSFNYSSISKSTHNDSKWYYEYWFLNEVILPQDSACYCKPCLGSFAVFVGNATAGASNITITLHSSSLGWQGNGPVHVGHYWLRERIAFKHLPPTWCGTCTLGAGLNPLVERPTSFHSFARWFIPWLGDSELEKALVNLSASLEVLANNTADALTRLQTEVTQISHITLRNRLALDLLLVNQGRVCTLVNDTCCTYVDESGKVLEDIHKIQNMASQFHAITTDNTSWGIQDAWDLLTSGLRWAHKLIVIIVALGCFFILTCCCIQCIGTLPSVLSTCCRCTLAKVISNIFHFFLHRRDSDLFRNKNK
uniref:Uncharacterized protein n=1 Tax=Crocodylus porosus TaxID=8502 RepID=A0A7M4EMZ7_CROPO